MFLKDWNGKPDRSIDLHIMNLFRGEKELKYRESAVYGPELVVYNFPDEMDQRMVDYIRNNDENSIALCPRYTADLDLVLTLVDKVAADRNSFLMASVAGDDNRVTIISYETTSGKLYRGDGASFIESTLRALFNVLENRFMS